MDFVMYLYSKMSFVIKLILLTLLLNVYKYIIFMTAYILFYTSSL